MQRRLFLRTLSLAVVGGVFVPKYGRWFQRFAEPAYVRSGVCVAGCPHDLRLQQVWRKVQHDLLIGFNYQTDEWQFYEGVWRNADPAVSAREIVVPLAVGFAGH